LIAFILGRNALIFQNRFTFTSFFRNFAAKSREVTTLGKKKKQVPLFYSRFFVTLHQENDINDEEKDNRNDGSYDACLDEHQRTDKVTA
jgi:hypothetical protein